MTHGRTRRRRGSTLAEMIFTLALCVTVVTAATLLYGSVVGTTLDGASMLETSDGGDRLGREIDFLINNAIAAEVKTLGGRTVLKLTMPAERGDRNANGLYDEYDPSFLHPRLADAYLPGERIWIYSGSPTVAISTASAGTATGTTPLLARRSDDATPAIADLDLNWTYRNGDAQSDPKYPANITLSFSQSGSVVAWTIGAVRADGSSAASIDTTNGTTFRELKLEGSSLLQTAGPP